MRADGILSAPTKAQRYGKRGPSISNPAGDGHAAGSDESVSEPAIAAALAAFHDGMARQRSRSYVATSARFLRGAGGAVLGLTVVAFAGGLFLAHVTVSGPEHPMTIGAFAPEMIYKRPAAAENALVAEHVASPVAESQNALAMLHAVTAQSSAEEEEPARQSTRELTAEAEQSAATNALAQNTLPEATANFVAAMRLHAIGGAQSGGTGSDITSGFAAEELPTVPEPAAGPAVALGVATLLGLQAFLRRRRNIL